jgi:methylated-DNA-[protein]-cysteine S-methyltransferase
MTTELRLYQTFHNSLIGTIQITGDMEAIHEIIFIDTKQKSESRNIPALLNDCIQQLDEYFSGKRKTFSLPLNPKGTEFQKRIWTLLQEIPYGKTISYADLALRAGDINLTRAVGPANGANKIAIIIPCHRVIGSNGKLTGYAGGLWRKEWLLNLERKDLQPELFESGINTTVIARK